MSHFLAPRVEQILFSELELELDINISLIGAVHRAKRAGSFPGTFPLTYKGNPDYPKPQNPYENYWFWRFSGLQSLQTPMENLGFGGFGTDLPPFAQMPPKPCKN